jgi:hypothetical protein
MHGNTIPEAGRHRDPCMIIRNASNAAFVTFSVLRGVFHKMPMDILWQIWITARAVASVPMNVGLVP